MSDETNNVVGFPVRPRADASADAGAPPKPGGSSVVGLPRRVPTDEHYVDRQQLAERMGVSVATIDRMVSAGMPSELWGARMRRFLPSQAIAWACTRGRRVA